MKLPFVSISPTCRKAFKAQEVLKPVFLEFQTPDQLSLIVSVRAYLVQPGQTIAQIIAVLNPNTTEIPALHIGQAATIGGKPVTDSTYVLPDTRVMRFENSKLVKIGQ
jgi:hypothetical protein